MSTSWPASCTKVAGETVLAFDKDRPRAVAEEALQHSREAWTVADGVRAAHCRIVEGLDDLVARGLGVCLARGRLSLASSLSLGTW